MLFFRLRGLHHLGILSKARYVAANSGATWVTLPLSVKDMKVAKETPLEPKIDFTEYLGAYVPPEKINAANIDQELGLIGHNLADSNMLDTDTDDYDKVAELVELKTVPWIARVANNFVRAAPYNLDSLADYWLDMCNAYCFNDNDCLMLKTDQDKSRSYRFPFIISCASVQQSNVPSVKLPIFPFEFTPFYSGLPVSPNNILKNLTWNFPLQSKLNTSKGGYVQSFAFGSDSRNVNVPEGINSDDLNVVSLARPDKVLKIAAISGISSSFWAAALSTVSLLKTIARVLKYITRSPFINLVESLITTFEMTAFWSPTPTPEISVSSDNFSFVDGGVLDNTGVLALLRRNVSTIIACVASDSEVSKEDEVNKGQFRDMAALFGQATYGKGDMDNNYIRDNINKLECVFENSDAHWKYFMDKLSENDGGDAKVVELNMKVIPNSLSGVTMARNVTIFFCVNRRVKNWTNSLTDSELKEKMGNSDFTGPEGFPLEFVWNTLFDNSKYRSGVSETFPYVSTFRVVYTKELVNAMAHLSSYSIVEGLKNFHLN